MKPEDKELLLKDLCARLPYEVIVNYGGYEGCDYKLTLTTLQDFSIEDLKPYLRPLPSMTEEEKKEYQFLCEVHIDHDADDNDTYYYFDSIESIDWLNKNMFDFRELIDRGLAIEVTKDNNPYED